MDAPSLPDLNTPAGEIARRDFVRLWTTETVAEALARLRREDLGERIVYFYVTAPDGTLEGVVPTRRLLLSDLATPVAETMVHPVVSVGAAAPFREALRAFLDRRLLALPVVGEAGRLAGVLDISAYTQTLINMERRDAADEIFQLAGLHIGEERGRGLWRALASRFPWLLTNIASGVAAAMISDHFSVLLRAVVALAFFVPLLLTLAESVAIQSVTLSLNELQLRRRGAARGGMLRELRVGLLLGLNSGALVGLIALAWLGIFKLAAIVAASIVAAGAIGAALGFAIPRLVRRWNLDPAVASGPVALAATDVAALVCYFGMAAAVLM